MPLPFAPKPDESKVYQSLKSTPLNAVTPEQLETLRGDVFAQGVGGTEDEYRRLVLLMLASQGGSVSGPIPGTGTLVQVEDMSSDGILFQPDEGVWQFLGGDILETNGGATFTINFRLTNDAAAGYPYALICTASSTGQEIIGTDTSAFGQYPVYVTNELSLWGDVTSGEGRVSMAFIRVR